MTTIAIIGGGASGALTAVQLLRQSARRPISISLIEKSGRFGRGLAYETRYPQHVLNVGAGRMSGLPDDAEHFLRWLKHRNPAADAATFAPRAWYGEYLAELLDHAAANAPETTRFERITDEALAVSPDLRVTLRGGRVIAADRVVLALGNFPPANPTFAAGDVREARCYVRDPWAAAALDGLAGDEPLLLIGTGLTAVDLVAAIHGRGHRGRITAVSRHGVLPHVHDNAAPPTTLNGELAATQTVRGLLRVLRRSAAEATRAERGWRSVMDALRPRVQELWRGLPDGERQRFLRHARAYWDIHRHRVAAEIDAVIRSLRRTGQLVVRAARLVRYAEDGLEARVTLRPRGSLVEESARFARVINCTGPATRLRDVDSPLLRSLSDRGLVRFDALDLGLDVDAHGALVDAAGAASAKLFALGPLRRGVLWESTAIPEIRVQADLLAGELLRETPPLR